MAVKGIYITEFKVNQDCPGGVEKKVLGQVDLLNSKENTCRLYSLESKKTCKHSYVRSKLPGGKDYFLWNYDKSLFDNLNYVYIRKPAVIYKDCINFLSKIKRDNKKIIIIMEFPTYLYDNEFVTLKGKIKLLIEKYNRKRLYKVVDRIALVANKTVDDLWKIPVIHINNGVNPGSVKKSRRDNEEIHLLAIAHFSFWHGYDRLLEGMNEYYKNGLKRKVILHMAGEGPELNNYKRYVDEHNLDSYVVFHGVLYGQNLDQIYDECDILVDGLGVHRRADELSCSLKSMEGLMKGMPIIGDGKISVLQDVDFNYQLVFGKDEKIDIEKIIDFYKKIKKIGFDTVAKEIHEFALQNCTFENAMKEVVSYIQNIK